MDYITSPSDYFTSSTRISFRKGSIAVFLNGGITFLTGLVTIGWMFQLEGIGPTLLTEGVGMSILLYTFFSSFVTWVIISTIFYTATAVVGRGAIGFTQALSITGLGFIPVVFGSTIELSLTFVSAIRSSPTEPTTTAHIILSGEMGIPLALAMYAIYFAMGIWSALIWHSAVRYVGKVAPYQSLILIGAITLVLFAELLYLGLIL